MIHSYGTYCLASAVAALALGVLAVRSPRALLMPRMARFLFGVGMTPFALGVCVVALATVAPGSPSPLFFAVPGVAGGVYLARLWRGGKLPRWNPRRYIGRLTRVSLATTAVAAALTAYAGAQLVRNAARPVSGYDALQYLGEAAEFAKERTLASIPGTAGRADGTVRGDLHSFAWPAYLAQALTAPPDALATPFRNSGARLAIQLTMLYLLAALGALAGSLRLKGVLPIAVPFFLQVPQLDYVTQQGARDAFRTIPLLLLAALLVAAIRRSGSLRSLRGSWFVAIGMVAGFCVGGHTLGLILHPSLVGLWVALYSVRRQRLKQGLAVVGATTLGALAFSTHYAWSFLRTGSLLGDNVVKHVAIAGTPLWEISLQRDLSRIDHTSGPFGNLWSILLRDHFRLSSLAVIAALAFLASGRGEPSRQPLKFLSAYLLALLLPVVGAFDFGTSALTGTSLSQWFQMNFRYFLHWYPIAAAVVGGGWVLLWGKVEALGPTARFGARSALAAAYCSISAAAFVEVSRWPGKDLPADLRVKKVVAALTAATSGGTKLVLEDLRYNYYLGNRAVVLYSRPTFPLLQAKTAEEAQAELRRLNVGAVAVMTKQIVGWWDQIPLWTALNDPAFAQVAYADDVLTIVKVPQPSP